MLNHIKQGVIGINNVFMFSKGRCQGIPMWRLEMLGADT
jgi:hypothetical protein